MLLCAGVDGLNYDDLQARLSQSSSPQIVPSEVEPRSIGFRWSRTFFPAYLPRVMIATLPTLRNFILKSELMGADVVGLIAAVDAQKFEGRLNFEIWLGKGFSWDCQCIM